MISVIILNNGEESVIKLTYENLWRELKDIPDSELIVAEDWLDYLPKIKNRYVCFVEPDCLVSGGFFNSQINLFKKNPMFRKLAVLASATGVNDWGNRFYGYSLGNGFTDGILPNKEKKSNQIYPVQIGYIPGSIIRMTMLRQAVADLGLESTASMNLVELSAVLSLAFWGQGDGNRVHINPNTTYVTTEKYVNDISDIHMEAAGLKDMFSKEAI